MDCQAISRDDLFEKYLNHGLDSATEDEFELHIFACSRCAQLLDLFLAMHADLTERAHEIRLQTPAKRLLFRWQAAALASILVIVGLASVWRIRNVTNSRPVSVVASAVPLESKSIQQSESWSLTPSQQEFLQQSLQQPLQETHPTATQHAKINSETARISSTAQTGEQPLPVPPPANEQIPAVRDDGPQIASNPTPDSDEVGNQIPVPPSANEQIPTGSDNKTQIASNPTPDSDEVGHQTKLTVEEGVELYRLGLMQAPPYTFPGLVSGEKIPDTHNSSSYSSKGLRLRAGRVVFQNAMNAYIDGRYKEAADLLENDVQLEPTAADANFYLGVCKLLAGRPQDSIAPLTNAAAAGNSPYLQSSHYYLAKAYIQSIKLAEAETELRHAIAVPGRLTADAKALLTRVQALRGQIEKQ